MDISEHAKLGTEVKYRVGLRQDLAHERRGVGCGGREGGGEATGGGGSLLK